MSYSVLLFFAGLGVALGQFHVINFQPCRPITPCEEMGYHCYLEHCQYCMNGDQQIEGVPGLCHGGQLCCMGGCPAGWDKFGDYCYWLNTDFLNWHDANDACHAEDAELVSIHSQDEQDFLNGIGSERWWIGLCDKTEEDVFVWSDSTPFTFMDSWYAGQPNDLNPGQDCVEHVVGGWNDVHCTAEMHSMCKKPVYS